MVAELRELCKSNWKQAKVCLFAVGGKVVVGTTLRAQAGHGATRPVKGQHTLYRNSPFKLFRYFGWTIPYGQR